MLETMIILRIYRDIATHFPSRRSEWISSGVMFIWGVIVLFTPGPTPPPWNQLKRAIDYEDLWAVTLISLGLLRLCALIVNGTFSNTWYSRVSPHVRVFASGICALIWLQLVLVTLGQPVLTTGFAAYFGWFVTDVLNSLSAAADAREMDKGRRHAAARIADAR